MDASLKTSASPGGVHICPHFFHRLFCRQRQSGDSLLNFHSLNCPLRARRLLKFEPLPLGEDVEKELERIFKKQEHSNK